MVRKGIAYMCRRSLTLMWLCCNQIVLVVLLHGQQSTRCGVETDEIGTEEEGSLEVVV